MFHGICEVGKVGLLYWSSLQGRCCLFSGGVIPRLNRLNQSNVGVVQLLLMCCLSNRACLHWLGQVEEKQGRQSVHKIVESHYHSLICKSKWLNITPGGLRQMIKQNWTVTWSPNTKEIAFNTMLKVHFDCWWITASLFKNTKQCFLCCWSSSF